jgi:predicted transcriptional regulator
MTTKVTISLPDDLARYTDDLAQKSGKPRSQIIAELIKQKRAALLHEELARGYAEMAEENLRFAREAFPMAAEIWDPYDWAFDEKPSPARKRKRSVK